MPLARILACTLALAASCTSRPPATDKVLPLPGEAFLLGDSELGGHEAFLILPPSSRTARPVPWVLYAPTLRGLPSSAEKWLFERLLATGIAIAGIDVGESYGSPAGCALYDRLHDYLVAERGLSTRPVLLGRSRGGLMTLSWAADRAERIGAFAGIYPVCDLRSYPGLDKAAGAFGTTPEGLETMLPQRNPIDRLGALAAAHVPIFAVHGDHDKTVPLTANSGALAERMAALGNPIELQVLPGRGHDMDLGFFHNEALLAFVIRCAH
jgi:pimeloyl-ACP methyl ester carboxylesterase